MYATMPSTIASFVRDTTYIHRSAMSSVREMAQARPHHKLLLFHPFVPLALVFINILEPLPTKIDGPQLVMVATERHSELKRVFLTLKSNAEQMMSIFLTIG